MGWFLLIVVFDELMLVRNCNGDCSDRYCLLV